MKTHCVNCKTNTDNENSSVRRINQNILVLVSYCAVCGNKNQDSLKSRSKRIIEQIEDQKSIKQCSIQWLYLLRLKAVVWF